MAGAARLTEPTRRRFTVDEYHRMSELGILSPGQRTELINGEILLMAAAGGPHLWCVNRLTSLLVTSAGERAVVSVQNPVQLSGLSEPEPDLTLLRPGSGAAEAVPAAVDVLLLIEVADSSLTYDRDTKLPLYARAGIPEVWIVDLNGGQVLVYRDPSGRRCQRATMAGRGERLAPLAFPEITIAVDAILG